MKCEFCSATGIPLYEVFLGAKSSMLFRCPSCGSCQSDPVFPTDQIQAYYRDAYFSRAKWQIVKSKALASDYITKISKHIGMEITKGSALEVGAGYGFFAEMFRRRYGIDIDIVEPSRDCQDFIRSVFPELTIVGETIDDLPARKRYQFIFCFHLLEHLQRLSGFLELLSNHLRSRGKIYILTPNADSFSFRILGRDWGWACPNQHYQFLSQRIPEDYFGQFALRLVFREDVHPAAIHFPSLWRSQILKSVSLISTRIGNKSKLRTAHWRVLRRVCLWLSTHLDQNQRTWGLLSVEKCVATLIGRRPRDELFMVLERV